MGGPGSGRRIRIGAKKLVENCIFLDIYSWKSKGFFYPGNSFLQKWTLGISDKSSIIVYVESANKIWLKYVVRSCGEAVGKEIRYPIWLDRTPCHRGGERLWSRCPTYGCGRRVARLYLCRQDYVCRHCGNLAYSSQNEDAGCRAVRRVQKIRKRLGGTSNLTEPFPEKPKGMHWRTYERMRAQAGHAQEQVCVSISEMIQKLR